MEKGVSSAVRLAGDDRCCPPQRVGVLTFHRCINYGSYWQTRCLVEALLARGCEVVVLDHVSDPINSAEWRVALRPTMPVPSSRADSREYACKTRKFLSEIAKIPLSKQIDVDNAEAWPSFDTIVVGSDEVWNLRHPWYAGKPAFFGIDLPAKKVVSYAASFGNYSCWEGLGSPWTDALSRFDALSVRDENSWWMLKNSLGMEPELVLDPCLLQDPGPSPPRGRGQGSNLVPNPQYAVVYGHNFSPEFAKSVKQWADRRKLPLLSIGYRNDWADIQWLSAGPHDFADAMQNAEAVATNFFHGCVFALRNEKPFACEVSPYRSIKVRGLMELLGGKRHLVGDGDVGSLLDQPLEQAIGLRITELRASSGRFLDRVLGGVDVSKAA